MRGHTSLEQEVFLLGRGMSPFEQVRGHTIPENRDQIPETRFVNVLRYLYLVSSL